jgi:hypothetical protein
LVQAVDIKPGYRTDHSLITLTLQFGKEQVRNLFWKFNSSLLMDKTYIEEINKEINCVKSEYAAFPYKRNTLENIPPSDIELTIPDQLFLDVLLMKIRTKTISYASVKKRGLEEKEKTLQARIEMLEAKETLSTDEKTSFENDKRELVKIRDHRMKGVLLRSRARWVEDGEKVSKYFCSLEKRNYVNKYINKLTLEDGSTTCETDIIVNEMKDFYLQLYSKRNLDTCEIEDLVNNIPRLSTLEADKLEGIITLEEASKALKNMKNGKSPGSDGFSVEFFKFFWRQLGAFVVRSLK